MQESVIYKFKLLDNYYQAGTDVLKDEKHPDGYYVRLPKGAEILSVDKQHNGVCFWASFDIKQREYEHRRFFLLGTGAVFDTSLIKKFLGTVILSNDNLVLHVFEGHPDEIKNPA